MWSVTTNPSTGRPTNGPIGRGRATPILEWTLQWPSMPARYRLGIYGVDASRHRYADVWSSRIFRARDPLNGGEHGTTGRRSYDSAPVDAFLIRHGLQDGYRVSYAAAPPLASNRPRRAPDGPSGPGALRPAPDPRTCCNVAFERLTARFSCYDLG